MLKSFVSLAAAASVDTFAGHVWLILDSSGKESDHFIIGGDSTHAPIQ